jgi:putative nucleotidyltransferase with HDIG domain
VSDYDTTDGKIILKIQHTYRVAELCERIADSIGLQGEDRELAWLLGMLHDIGRFPQVRRYGTFIDSQSVDHALLSTQVLFEEKVSVEPLGDVQEKNEECYIRRYVQDEKYDSIIYTAIRHHNAYRLPEGLDERTLLFCNILRDADKVDILKVNVEFPMEVIYGEGCEKAYEEEVTPEVFADYMAQGAVLRAHNKNHVDLLVGHASLVFELVFPISVQIVREQGYLKNILNFETKNKTAQEQFVLMRRKMDEYMESRCAADC